MHPPKMDHDEGASTNGDISEQCQFYVKIGACRHGEKCSRIHTKPTTSQTIIIRNMYRHAKAHLFPYGVDVLSEDLEQSIFDDFFEEVFTEIEDTCGRIREMHVCENHGAHLSGNVYVRFSRSSAANRATRLLTKRFFAGVILDVELSPVTDFHDASCRQHQTGCCSRGGICNFMHVRIPSAAIRTRLNDRFRMPSRSTTPESESERAPDKRRAKRSESKEKEKDTKLPSRYQHEEHSSSDSSVEQNTDSDGNTTDSRATPKAFRTDRFNSDSENEMQDQESDEEQRQLRNKKMRLIRQRRWAILRAKMNAQEPWDEEKERNYVFSLL